ncbi:TonB-dependent receptor plug domain-containing protein [uncultured Sphingomonas sp.]|uniref:TonB-dependent receptor plug domain-containing protein n=1 Tax=uncultured Sphingomonas sp. TaxID=158754 RepID=UPI0035CC76AF
MRIVRTRLLSTTLLFAVAVMASPAYAQSTQSSDETPAPVPNTVATQGPQEADAPAEGEDVVVTGSIFRRTDIETPSPLTTVTAEALDQRGINTVQEGIQQLTFNNGPALTNSFTSNGAFAAGASSVSLRGLSTNSTLVLFDGLRAAYYPLADDGSRNFVDLNTIPDDIVDRIEVLRDGASSTYGADAIAGVVNIITKRQFVGIGARVEAGITERGDGANQRLSLTLGTGDLDEDRFNVYASGFYLRQEALFNHDRPYPFNTDDQRGIGTGGPNNIINGLDANGAFQGFSDANTGSGALSTFYVRPANAANTAALGRYQQLNPALGCVRGSQYTLTGADLAANPTAPGTVCQEDLTNQFGVISPNIERFGGSARATAKVGDSSEAYLQVNFQQSRVNYTGGTPFIRANAPAGILFPRFSTQTSGPIFAAGSGVLALPVFVCAAATNCDTATDRRLNPNNPFAAQGQVARLIGRLPNEQTFNETRSRVYRAAAGVNGTVFDDLDYSFDLTAMHNDLRRTQDGFVFISNLLTAIGNGSYNFANPSANSQATLDFLTPVNITGSESDLYQAQFSAGKKLFDLPGGPLQLGVGVAFRYESVDSPSANPDSNGPTNRYFTINAFGSSGSREVYSAFAELDAPIVDQFTVNASGRYDKYSSGQDAFSPKIGAKFTPIRQVAIRGTYSRGFRIPSFAEANALPTTGFVTASSSIYPDAFLAQYNCTQATFSTCPTYIRTATYGLTSLGTEDLEPEKSRSFTGGVILEPIRGVAITIDYFNIKKTNAITTANASPALAAYYANAATPDGYNVIADVTDSAFPNARPRIGFIESGFVNANTIKSEGIDFSATASFPFGDGFRFTSSADASLILELSTTFPDGTKERYEGTLGNFNLTAGSGTPEWRISWQNTLDLGDFILSGTANYFDGYNLSAEDQTGPGTQGDGGLAPEYVDPDVPSYTTVDVTGSFKVNDQFTFYVNVLNILDDLPPIDVVTYGAHLYNPVQGGTGIYGRSFRAGIRVGL